ncbi:MAG TPA: hypothetical protein VFN61_03425 [Acidimicrobiales bacterium]|nr:hypothetical protein [Acidimicrobiales bacterium]
MARKKGPRSQPVPEGAGADEEVVELYDVGADQPTGAWSAVDDTYDGTQWEHQTGYWREPGVDVAHEGVTGPHGDGTYDPELTNQIWHDPQNDAAQYDDDAQYDDAQYDDAQYADPQYAGYDDQGGWREPAPGYYEDGEYDRTVYQEPGYQHGDYETARYSAVAYDESGYPAGRVAGYGPAKRRRANGPWPELAVVTALAVVAAAVVLAYMTGSHHQSSGNSASTTTPPSSSSRPSTTQRPTTSAGGGTTTLPIVSNAAVRLSVTAGVEQSLVKSWLATNPGAVGIGSKDVAGTVPGEVYYAHQPALGTYWALAAFQPSPQLTDERATAAGQAKLQQFQNVMWVFSWRAGPTWTELGEVSTGQCPDIWVPTPVLASWGLCGLRPPHA